MTIRKLFSFFKSLIKPADLSVFHEFVPPPYGGGNQFMKALCKWMEEHGCRIEINKLSFNTKACLYNSFNFDYEYLKSRKNKSCCMVHRVDGPISSYRGYDDGTDAKIEKYNLDLAHRTVFQSDYSYQKHIELGYQFREPVVIRNAVDSDIFNRIECKQGLSGDKIKIISASWSTNEKKGFETYRWLASQLDLEKYEYTFVGRTPYELPNVNVINACPSEKLSAILKEQDIYLTASEDDPCSNSLIEALACGLPSIVLNSGGHPEIVGEAGLSFNFKEEIPVLLSNLVSDYESFQDKTFVYSMDDIGMSYLQILGLVSK